MPGIKQKPWCLYVLKCRGNYLYIGITNDLEKRLDAHARGAGSKFVRARLPFKLVRTVPCSSATEARKLEGSLKRLTRAEKIEHFGLRIGRVRK